MSVEVIQLILVGFSLLLVGGFVRSKVMVAVGTMFLTTMTVIVLSMKLHLMVFSYKAFFGIVAIELVYTFVMLTGIYIMLSALYFVNKKNEDKKNPDLIDRD